MTTNTRETFFKHKEHYLAFRAAWAKAVNSEKAKSHLEACDEWNEDACDFTKGTGSMRIKGWVTGAHMMLYNILRGKEFDAGFTPITNTNKLKNGVHINNGLYTAGNILARKIETARKGSVDKEFLEIFDGTVTVEMIAAIDLPEVRPMNSDYGPYKKVAEHIIESNKHCKPSTFTDIEAIRKYVINPIERLRHVFQRTVGRVRKNV